MNCRNGKLAYKVENQPLYKDAECKFGDLILLNTSKNRSENEVLLNSTILNIVQSDKLRLVLQSMAGRLNTFPLSDMSGFSR